MGQRYTIKDHDGTVLALEIDQAALQRDYPQLAFDIARMVDGGGDARHIGIGSD